MANEIRMLKEAEWEIEKKVRKVSQKYDGKLTIRMGELERLLKCEGMSNYFDGRTLLWLDHKEALNRAIDKMEIYKEDVVERYAKER